MYTEDYRAGQELAVLTAHSLTHVGFGWSGCFGSFVLPKFRATMTGLQYAQEKSSGGWPENEEKLTFCK